MYRQEIVYRCMRSPRVDVREEQAGFLARDILTKFELFRRRRIEGDGHVLGTGRTLKMIEPFRQRDWASL